MARRAATSHGPRPADLGEGHAPLEATRNGCVVQLARGADLGGVIAEQRELLHGAEEGDLRRLRRRRERLAVELVEQRALLRARAFAERAAPEIGRASCRERV